MRRGLWPASESSQAKQQSEPQQSSPTTQPDEPPRVEPVPLPKPAPAADAGDQAITAIPAADVGDQVKAVATATEAAASKEPPYPVLVAAVKNRLNNGHRPGAGGDEQWDRFCDEVRKVCKKKATDRGYGDKTIKRIVATLNRQDKQDK